MANPTNLNALDENQPNGAVIPVSQLDDFDRETRRYLKGWPTVEHDLTGVHAFGVGPTSDRPPSIAHPVAPVIGTVFFNTDTMQVEVFNGAMWITFGSPSIPVGSITVYSGVGSIPAGWAACDGAAISRVTFATLFGIIGTTYGIGDGVTTFNVPDLRGRVPVGQDGSAEFLNIGQTGGAKTSALAGAALGTHVHSVSAHKHELPYGVAGPTFEVTDDAVFVDSGITRSMTPIIAGGTPGTQQTKLSAAGTGNTDPASGGTPAGTTPTLPPYLVVRWMIKV